MTQTHHQQANRQQELEDIVAPVCTAHGCELVEVRLVSGRGLIVRVMIDRERPEGDPRPGSGVTIDDCTAVSRDLSTALDIQEGIIDGKYHLEVTSPGLDRPLVRPGDYTRFAGEEVKVKTHERVVGDRRSFQGRLLGIDEDRVEVEVGGKTFEIPYEAIARANLVPKL